MGVIDRDESGVGGAAGWSADRGGGRAAAWLAVAAVVAVHAAVFVWVMGWLGGGGLSGGAGGGELVQGRAASDAFNFHEPTIRRFASEWPRVDLSNYFSATTPLYHLVLAGVCRFVSGSRAVLMGAGAVPSAVLFGWVAYRSARRLGVWAGGAVAACVPASVYVLPASVWLLPDNAAWLGVLAVLALCVRGGWGRVAAASVVLVALVLTRQIHVWAAGVIWASAWLGAGEVTGATVAAQVRGLLTGVGARVRRTVWAVVGTLPAFAAVAWFVREWGGLVVPRYQVGWYSGWNPATPAFFLALFGVASAAFVGFWWDGLVRAWRGHRWWVVASGAGAAAVALVPQTTYTADSLTRISGLWNAAKLMPSIAGHTSPVILLPAVLGGVAAAGWACSVRARSAWVLGAGAAGFVAAQTASPLCWQRYHEPFVLLLMVLLAGEAARRPMGGRRAWSGAWSGARSGAGGGRMDRLMGLARVVGPMGMAACLALVTATAFRRVDPVTRQLDHATEPPTNLGDVDAALAAEPVAGFVVVDSPPPRKRE